MLKLFFHDKRKATINGCFLVFFSMFVEEEAIEKIAASTHLADINVLEFHPLAFVSFPRVSYTAPIYIAVSVMSVRRHGMGVTLNKLFYVWYLFLEKWSRATIDGKPIFYAAVSKYFTIKISTIHAALSPAPASRGVGPAGCAFPLHQNCCPKTP